jgi:hypothetical protein
MARGVWRQLVYHKHTRGVRQAREEAKKNGRRRGVGARAIRTSSLAARCPLLLPQRLKSSLTMSPS